MTTRLFKVDYERFDTLEEAETYARSKAWANGTDQKIYKVIAIAKAPEQVNTVKVEQVT